MQEYMAGEEVMVDPGEGLATRAFSRAREHLLVAKKNMYVVRTMPRAVLKWQDDPPSLLVFDRVATAEGIDAVEAERRRLNSLLEHFELHAVESFVGGTKIRVERASDEERFEAEEERRRTGLA